MDFPVVGIGVSTGGLDDLRSFLAQIAAGSGLAFVVVTHHPGAGVDLLPRLLAPYTTLAIEVVTTRTAVAPDRVYFADPAHALVLRDGELSAVAVSRRPIDDLFCSLAHEEATSAIGVLFAGTGEDGIEGAAAIKRAYGMVMIQEPASARHAGLPSSVHMLHAVDYVQPIEALPALLLAHVAGPWRSPPTTSDDAAPPRGALGRILELIEARSGRDVSHLARVAIPMLHERMRAQQIRGLAQYAQFLATDHEECDRLADALLVGNTQFFRDAGAFAALAQRLPALALERDPDAPVRVWVPGCSTGQEAYSLAVLLREALALTGEPARSVRIFATDRDAAAIDVARAGRYPASIADEIDAARLAQYFERDGDGFRVGARLREIVVFAAHDLLVDPPLSRVDVISCRNVLMYLDAGQQARVVATLHRALRPGGLLFIGPAESIDRFDDLFRPVDSVWRIFARREPTPTREPNGPITVAASHDVTKLERRAGADRLLLDQLVPATALVRTDGEIEHLHGRVARYLELAAGVQRGANLLALARPGLRGELPAAVREALIHRREVCRAGIRVACDDGPATLDLRVRPVEEPGSFAGMLLVVMTPSAAADAPVARGARSSTDRLDELEHELHYVTESMQSTIAELELANEELNTGNEELLSSNEDLQATNDHLEALRRELQRLNEKLRSELDTLLASSAELGDLLQGTACAVVFVDRELVVERFVEHRKVLRLLPTDVGRTAAEVFAPLEAPRVLAAARHALDTRVSSALAVAARDGGSFLVRIVPRRATAGLALLVIDVPRSEEVSRT